jgi:hypothetical protein
MEQTGRNQSCRSSAYRGVGVSRDESGVLAGGSEVTRRLSCWFDYLGGNCESGTGSARFSVGALSMNPITAQLMSVPVAP